MRLMRVGLVAVAAMGVAKPAWPAADPKWEVEVHGGAMTSSNPAGGTTALPLPGGVIFSVPQIGEGRATSSWYFGDGALELNQALASLRLGAAIVPLDPVLQSRFAERRTGGTVGVRLSRTLSPRFGAEISLDEAFAPLAFTTSSIRGVAESSLSFNYAWNTMLRGQAAGQQIVTSNATTNDRRGRETSATGALLVNLREGTRLTPYAAVGGGFVWHGGGTAAAQLVGNYQFTFPPVPVPVPIPVVTFNQTDTVTVRTTVENRFAWVLGGGIKYALNNRWGARLDVRDYVMRDPQRTVLEASPTSASTGGPVSLTLALGSSPPIIFSSRSGSPSTLSGATVNPFTTFKGTGIVNQLNLSVGLFWKF